MCQHLNLREYLSEFKQTLMCALYSASRYISWKLHCPKPFHNVVTFSLGKKKKNVYLSCSFSYQGSIKVLKKASATTCRSCVTDHCMEHQDFLAK